MKVKQITAGLIAAAVMLEGYAPLIATNVTAEPASSPVFNSEGLWLTEIYQNDVDRSKKNDKRASSGYEPIQLYTSTTDLMEFLEVTSTFDEPINLNDKFEIYYGETPLTVTDMDGNSDIIIEKGQPVVLWNYRTDVTSAIPTEEEFRKALRIPDDAIVLKAVCGLNWTVTSSFSIKSKDDGSTVSSFKAVDKLDTVDGYSVELKIPDIGSEMQVYRQMTIPSPGYVYSGQMNGLVNARVPDQEYAKGVYITEVRPNDVSREAYFGTSDDYMECVEIVNTTDKPIDLNKDYQVMYVVKEGSRKPLPMYRFISGTADELTDEDCIVPAGGTAVLWCYRKNLLTGYTSFPTEADFRAAYNIPENVQVFAFTNQSGLNNTNRAFEVYEKNGDGTKTLVSSYSYYGATDCKDNKSAELSVNPEGPEMLLTAANTSTSMGIVKYDQYAYIKDDGSTLKLQLDDTIPSSVMQGEEIRVDFYFDVTGALPRTGISTYYRFDGEGKWYSSTEVVRRVPNLYQVLIPADELFSHDYVEFYVSADNRYHSSLSPIYRVDIDKLNEFAGIRTNISDGEEVTGSVTVTANDGSDNSRSEIYIDGEKYETALCLEDGAYFTFHADGRDSYFKNAVTTTDNEIIASISKWQYTTLDGQALHIDNSCFKYNAETGNYDVTLRFWAGTYNATVDEYLVPDANREDFTVTQLALKLINGNVYYPTLIGPDNEETKAKTNLSTDYSAVHSIGDSAGMCPYMDVSFSVPASEVTAVGASLESANLSEGTHELLVTNGNSRQRVTFTVDNTAPVIDLGIKNGDELSGVIKIDPKVTEANTLEKLTITLDDKLIETPYAITAAELGKGEHTLVVNAQDAAGNFATESAVFTVSDSAITLVDAGTSDITDSSAKLYLNVQSDSDANAVFFRVEKIDASDITSETVNSMLPYIRYTVNVGDISESDNVVASWDGTASGSDRTHAVTMYVLNTETGKWDNIARADANGSIKSVMFNAKNHVSDGKAQILVQCTADSALPQLDITADGSTDNNAGWTGDLAPVDYDFCFAWETDTQYYAEEWQNHYLNMNRWIVDNAEEKKIVYTIHTGDIVDDCDMIYQWENADEAMKIFDDAGMPYGVLGGNHDVAAGLEDFENYYTYFGEDRFVSQPTFGGSYKNNRGHYDLISEGGQDFIIVYMSWNIYREELDWMNEVLQQYSDRKAILCFHTYANVKYSGTSLLDYYGELIQKEVIAKNSNVFAVLNGHYHGSSYETVKFDDNGDGVNERTVYQICTDYQSGFEGGNEYIKFLYFDLDNNRIYMNSYSPCLDDYNFYDDAEVRNINVEGESDIEVDKMVLDVNFNTDEQTITENSFSVYVLSDDANASTVQVDKTTGAAELTVDGLDAETDYAWLALISNSDAAEAMTGVYEFTTEKKPEEPTVNPGDDNSDTSDDNSGDDSSDTSDDNSGDDTSSDTSDDNSGDDTSSDTSDDNSGDDSSSDTSDDNSGDDTSSDTSDDNSGDNSSSDTSDDNSDDSNNSDISNPLTNGKIAIPAVILGLSSLGVCVIAAARTKRKSK